MKWRTASPQVLIVGAGPVGMLTALVLAREGVPIRIIDRGSGPCSYSYALALHHRTLALLQAFGMLEDIMSLAYPVARMTVFAELEQVSVPPLSQLTDDAVIPFLVTLPQSSFEQLLLERLAAHGVHVNWSHQLARIGHGDDGVNGIIERLEERMTGSATPRFEYAVASRRAFQVPWLLACDGWRSRTRECAGIPWITVGPDTEYAVFECETEANLDYKMTIRLTDGLVNVCWPLDAHHCRWSFELPRHSASSAERTKDRDMIQLGHYRYACPESSILQRYLSERVPSWGNFPGGISWRMVVPFGRGLAAEFGDGHCLLLGDASHVTAPGGVQSMNSGLLEAATVARRLAGVIRNEVSADSIVELQAATRDHWRQRLGCHPEIHLRPDADRRLGGYAAKLFESLPASGDELDRLSEAIGLSTPAMSAPFLTA